jgi:signal transduction histidine kinase
MGAEIEATGLVESFHPEDADELAARPAVGDHGATAAQDTHLAGARPVVPTQPGAVAGPADTGEEAAPADGERLRLARELHDTIASAIAVIAIQAGVADHALERCQAEPQRAREALRTIRAASQQALDELQATVTTLRRKAGAHRPRPGVAQLDALTNLADGAGVRVELAVVGAAQPLPPAVDLAVYRIVQEALTNVLRHAGPATAMVRLTYRAGDLTVQVDDDGHRAGGRRPSGGGNGLLGMGERVATLGGQLQAGPRPGGGFRVLATIPVDHTA